MFLLPQEAIQHCLHHNPHTRQHLLQQQKMVNICVSSVSTDLQIHVVCCFNAGKWRIYLEEGNERIIFIRYPDLLFIVLSVTIIISP
jgi:hypothetical protein